MDPYKRSRIFGTILVILLFGFLAWYLFTHNPKNPGNVDIGTEVDAYVDSSGYCVGRAGIEMGMCCGVWDKNASKIVWVDCKTLVVPKATQALFTFESGSQVRMDAVMFTVRLTSTGNVASQVKIDDVTVTSNTNDATSLAEIRTAFLRLAGTYVTVQPQTYTEFRMNSAYPIRLSTSTFNIADGTYSITINIKCKNIATGVEKACGSRTVTMVVSQEVESFQISVNYG